MFFLYMVLVVVGMAALMVLLTRTTVGAMGKLGGDAFQRIHESLEYIVETGGIPPFWLSGATRRLDALQERNSSKELIDRELRRVKRRCFRQLDKLIRYAQNTSTVADEETRSILLQNLTEARERWQNLNWYEFLQDSRGR